MSKGGAGQSDKFVDLEAMYEPDENGLLSTGEYWNEILEWYKRNHPYDNFIETDPYDDLTKNIK